MPDLTFPGNPDQLTAEWLTSVLDSAGVLSDGAVDSFTWEPIRGGKRDGGPHVYSSRLLAGGAGAHHGDGDGVQDTPSA